MPPQNSGSFGAAIGGGSAIAEAMSRRGMGGGAMQQVSPSAPTFEPGTQPASVGGGQRQPAVGSAGASGSPPSPAGSPGMPPGSFESQIIVKALDSRLKSLSKIEEAQNTQGGF